MKKDFSPFCEYKASLPEDKQALLDSYFADLDSHIDLPKNYANKLRTDFENALLRYEADGVELDEAIRRLAVSKLGGFYARPPILWYPLDDAAKIYPLSMKRGQMVVYRISIHLKQTVVPEILQMALNFTIKRFPSFATTVKKGFFWHYLDTAKRRFKVMPESGIPCRPLNISASGSQSFRVMYYENRISAEFFHVLTDGTGSMAFLKTLTAEYLRLMGAEIPCTDGIYDIAAIPKKCETENDFPKAEPSARSGILGKRTVQMSGRRSGVRPCRILHFEFDSSSLHSMAKEHGASVTEFLLSRIFAAQRYATDGINGVMQIQVPVNMRKYFQSETLRNFSLYCCISVPLADVTDGDSVLPLVQQQMRERSSREKMNEMMNSAEALVRALRYVPLFVKRPVAKAVYGFLGDKVFANGLSNLGVIKVPPEMSEYIEKCDCVLGTADSNRAACGLVTFGNVTGLSIAKYTKDPSFEEKLYELLTNDGLEVSVKGSPLYES